MSKSESIVSIPPISPALVSWLEAQYPDKAPDIQWRKREVWEKAGQAKLVRGLKAHLQRQQATVLAKS